MLVFPDSHVPPVEGASSRLSEHEPGNHGSREHRPLS